MRIRLKMSKVANIGDKHSLETPIGPVVVIHMPDGYFAMEDTCKHMDALLSEGPIEGDILVCPLHGWEFDIRTGKCVAPTWGSGNKDNLAFPVTSHGDELEIELDNQQEETS